MLKINNVKIGLNEENYTKKLSQVLNISKGKIREVVLVKQAVDARRKNNISFNCSFTFCCDHEETIMKQNKKLQITKVTPYRYPTYPPTDKKIVVVGSGPAGLFCAYNLARCNQKVILIEQGQPVEQRKQDVDQFFKTGELLTNSNIQFGEGGAGTFSDGKLTTGVKDFRKQFILETLVKHGANDDILYKTKPHLGTDYLMEIVKNMRNYIIEHQGTILFNTKLIDLTIKKSKIVGIVVEQASVTKEIEVDQLVLATGHSARDTYQMLYDHQVVMSQKPFAIGMRIEHLQSFINESQYGSFASHPRLPVAEYKLAKKTSNNRGCYTFCMCPGGQVVNASSEEGQVVVNGMSSQKRNGKNANSAILVTISCDDFKDDHPLAGIAFQKELERKAFVLGGSNYFVPIQRVEDYLSSTMDLAVDTVLPSVYPNTTYANLNDLFSKEINISLKEGLLAMNENINGFTSQAMLSGVESRSSSPVRIERNERMESSIQGIYPIGEGAGFAGGIMSSAIDGLKCSEIILKGEI